MDEAELVPTALVMDLKIAGLRRRVTWFLPDDASPEAVLTGFEEVASAHRACLLDHLEPAPVDADPEAAEAWMARREALQERVAKARQLG